MLRLTLKRAFKLFLLLFALAFCIFGHYSVFDDSDKSGRHGVIKSNQRKLVQDLTGAHKLQMGETTATVEQNMESNNISLDAEFKNITADFKSRRIEGMDCLQIINNDQTEIKRFRKQIPTFLPNDTTILKHTKHCDIFRKLYGYNDIINTDEELDFPIAFNILFYKEVAQVEMLLRTIYRPQNSYCLHVDGLSPSEVHKAAKSLADCFPNVFIVSKTENVVYKSFQRLQADINCMEDHLKRQTDWKYLMNLPGEQYPIKTNLEMVRILSSLNNTNSIECTLGDKYMKVRYMHRFNYTYNSNGSYIIKRTKEKNPPPPHNMRAVKGSAYGVFTRQFVDYIINNQTAKDLLEWCRTVLSPDEYYWHMLHHNPHLQVPGRIPGAVCGRKVLSVFVNWGDGKIKCHGSFLRGVCVFDVGDLADMVNMKGMFANKFKYNDSYATLQCLEEWMTYKTHTAQIVDTQMYRRWLGLL